MNTRLILGPLLLLSLAAVASADNAPARRSFPTFGISCVQPPGTNLQPASEPTHVILFRSPAAMLLVEVQPRIDQSLDDYAATLATRGNVSLVAGNFTIGGEAAVKIAGVSPDGAYRTVYIALHNSRGYIFHCSGRDAAANDQLFASFLPTVRFVSPDAPSEHLDAFYPHSITLLSQISINGPSCLRSYPHAENTVMLGMRDLVNDTDPFFVNVQRITLPNVHRFSDIYASLGPALQERLHLDEAPAWHPHATIANLFVSQFVGAPNPNNPDKHLLTRYAALDLGAGNYIQLVFTVEDRKDLDIQAYKDVTDRMLDTVSIPAAAAVANTP